ncbi:MAG TPA: SGNH/GDSL hydrolase family protein [Stackebrandtia sp.]|jgi:lysophospholipase L1-like esterase|uniref:SGNH/GDSL hydrolase family protein n=1 Tax=Stackebrandtia sp. TaxID=2023065 RepID=UPI002D592FFC|nr:SGNH/GDSL hydrolase family protein [Stackebrandtia sp.]HZE41923.1 SGNH/GDSL hydrolase family protein [Stackebrandtia sp.]
MRTWTTAWTASPQRPSEGFEPNWSLEGFHNHTIRQTVRVTAGGRAARVTLSNEYGRTPLLIGAASIARARPDGTIEAETLRPLTFDAAGAAKIAAGGVAASDRADLALAPFDAVVVTIHLPEVTGPSTFHAQAYASSCRAGGGSDEFTETTHSWYYLSDIEVSGGVPAAGAVAAFGDSITDGFGSTYDANRRYPDRLAERLTALGRPRPVLNAGIGGNLVLNDSRWFGESALRRFDRDVLAKSGVSTVILFAGLNDIGFSEVDLPTYKPNADVAVERLIDGVRELAARARAKGVRAVGATLLPMKGAEYYNAASAEKIRRLNAWIRTGGAFDAVVDLHAALADPGDPEALHPRFDSGDHKHPNDLGYAALAAAIDPGIL